MNMNTNHDTVTIFFVFAFTYCGVKIYKEEEAFMRMLLENNRHVELLEEEPKSYDEIDTRVLMHLVFGSLQSFSDGLKSMSKTMHGICEIVGVEH